MNLGQTSQLHKARNTRPVAVGIADPVPRNGFFDGLLGSGAVISPFGGDLQTTASPSHRGGRLGSSRINGR
jgi:hypothetical protein